MAKHNLWKTAGLIGIGYILKDYTNKKPIQYKTNNNAFIKSLENVIIDGLAVKLGLNPSSYKRMPSSNIIPKVSYAEMAKNRKNIVLYKDIILSSEDRCKTFKEMVTALFNDQNGYITVLQYMNLAGEETFPTQNNYGWTSLNGFNYRWTIDGWLVSMPYPVPLP